MNAKYRVTLWEMERGWGRSLFGERDFDTLHEAQNYQNAENAKNTSVSVPDWYVMADSPVLVDADAVGPPRE